MPRYAVTGLDRDALTQARIARGLTQEDLAIKLNVATNTVRNWETGRGNPMPNTFALLLRVLNISRSELLLEAEDALDALADYRRRAGLSQREAAGATGLPWHRLREIERGVRVATTIEAQTIAGAYGIAADDVTTANQRLHSYRHNEQT
ncbi:helix-turn-helix transcriptional regulator [Antricoccus suffuscus]|nr:helix-turn-helix transcriptional regulator [Antricoccus suffuscus]